MMADRLMRGSRLGSVSYETDRNQNLAPRLIARYRTENGEEFEVPFAEDAEIPGTWRCRNGMEGALLEGGDPAEPKKVKVPRNTLGHAAGTPLDRGTRGTAQGTPRDHQGRPPRQLA
jgi:RNA polymerase-binding protein